MNKGVHTFPKAISSKVNLADGVNNGVHTFPKGVSLKVNLNGGVNKGVHTFPKGISSKVNLDGGVNKGVHTFPKSVSSNVNVIARLEFELAYFEAAVQHISYYATEILPYYYLKNQTVFFLLLDLMYTWKLPTFTSEFESHWVPY